MCYICIAYCIQMQPHYIVHAIFGYGFIVVINCDVGRCMHVRCEMRHEFYLGNMFLDIRQTYEHSQ